MSRATAVSKRDRDSEYLGQIDANLREVRQILKELKRDRKLHPPPGRRKVSIVDEIKTILGIK